MIMMTDSELARLSRKVLDLLLQDEDFRALNFGEAAAVLGTAIWALGQETKERIGEQKER